MILMRVQMRIVMRILMLSTSYTFFHTHTHIHPQLTDSFEYVRVAELLTSINTDLQSLSKYVLLSKLDGVKDRIDTAKHTIKR